MNLRLNNLDDLIINQGYMSQRTKSPRRVNPSNGLNKPYENNYEMYPNVNKLNSNRDMSPNKMVSKNKPLLGANNRTPLAINNYKNPSHQIPVGQRYASNQYQPKPQNFHGVQNNGNWRHIKSPRSPLMQNQTVGSNLINGSWTCYNHSGKKAQYAAQIDGQAIYYCQTCAAKLAAQSFQVIKLPTTASNARQGYDHKHTNNPKLVYKARQIPSFPQYKGNPVYQSVIEFLGQISTVQQYHYENHHKLQSFDQHYQHQIQMVDEFYLQLLDILQNMRKDHISDLNQERKKNSQVKDIYINQIFQNLQTIEQIANDLDQNFQAVVSKITQEDIQFFNQVLEKNRSNIRFFVNQVQQQRDTLKEVTTYKEERLMEMITQFQRGLLQLWVQPKSQKQNFNLHKNNLPQDKYQSNPPQQSQSQGLYFNHSSSSNNINLQSQKHVQNGKSEPQQKLNVLQMHQNLPKSTLTRDFEGKGACRQIFDDDDDDEEEQNIYQQVSPKFKNI